MIIFDLDDNSEDLDDNHIESSFTIINTMYHLPIEWIWRKKTSHPFNCILITSMDYLAIDIFSFGS